MRYEFDDAGEEREWRGAGGAGSVVVTEVGSEK